MLPPLKTVEVGLQSRNVGSSMSWKRQRPYPTVSRKENSCVDILTLCWTSNLQNWKVMNLHCFTWLDFKKYVVAEIHDHRRLQ